MTYRSPSNMGLRGFMSLRANLPCDLVRIYDEYILLVILSEGSTFYLTGLVCFEKRLL